MGGNVFRFYRNLLNTKAIVLAKRTALLGGSKQSNPSRMDTI